MNVVEYVRRHSLRGWLKVVLSKLKFGYWKWRHRNAPVYENPTPVELIQIEQRLLDLGIEINDYAPSRTEFDDFQSQGWFPPRSHFKTTLQQS